MQLETAQLGHAQPRAVEHLEHGVVAQLAPSRLAIGRRRRRAVGRARARRARAAGGPSRPPTWSPIVGSASTSSSATAPHEVAADRRRLAGDAAAGELAGREVRHVAAHERAGDAIWRGDARPRHPLGEQPHVGGVGAERVRRQRANGRARTAPSRQGSSWSTSATLTTVFAHGRPTLDPDNLEHADSNQPPCRRPGPVARAESQRPLPRIRSTPSAGRSCRACAVDRRTVTSTSASTWRSAGPAAPRTEITAVVETQRDEYVVDATSPAAAHSTSSLFVPLDGAVTRRARHRHHGDATIGSPPSP